jgi:hypothetical protein
MWLAEQLPEHDYELAPVLAGTQSFNVSNSSSATTRPCVPVSHWAQHWYTYENESQASIVKRPERTNYISAACHLWYATNWNSSLTKSSVVNLSKTSLQIQVTFFIAQARKVNIKHWIRLHCFDSCWNRSIGWFGPNDATSKARNCDSYSRLGRFGNCIPKTLPRVDANFWGLKVNNMA